MKSIGLKLFIIVGAFVTLFSLFLFYRTYLISSEHVYQVVNQQADLALQFDLAIRNYVRDEIRPVMFEFVSEDEFIPETMSTSFVARSIFDETKKTFPGIILKFSSDNPRNPANQASPEELEIIKFFNENPDEKLWEGNITMNGKTYFAKFNARRMEESCLLCHGDPADAPQSMLDRYGSTAGFYRPVGEVIAMDTVAIPISTIQEHLQGELKQNFTLIGAALFLLLASLYVAVRFFITHRLKNIATHFEKASTTKDFRQISLLDEHGNDEISALAKTFNILAGQLQEYHGSLENEINERQKTNLLLNEEILERARTENELRQSKATLENVLNSSNPMCITSLAYEIVMANDAYYDAFGQHPDEHKIYKCYETRPGSLCNTDECPLKQIINGREIVSSQVAKKDSNGNKINYIVTARPLRDAEDKLIGIIENFQDISKLKQYEKALSAEKERLAVTLNSIGDGVISTTTDGTIVMLNKVAQSLTGWRQDEAAGRNLNEIFHIIDEKGTRNTDLVKRVIESKQVIEFSDNYKLIAKDGREYLIEDSAAPIFDRLSDVLGVVVVFRDVTNEKRIEKELEKARKIESIGVLAGGIAHDFNNILTAITGNISLAKMFSEPDSKVQARLEEAEKACLRASGLTQQLITFSKGGTPIKKTTSIRELLEDSARFVLRGSNVKCDFSFPEKLHPCEIDDGQVSQVINNMIINADQAMPDGGRITLTAENITVDESSNLPLKNGDYVKIVIQDTGVGIAPEDINKIFDPYFSTKDKGSGLGLASSYSIIKKHGGYIAVESTVGEGSSFTVYLPAAASKPKVETEKIIPAATTPIRGEGKILVMDDEEPVRKTVKDILTHLGYETELALDGNEAIEMYMKARDAGSPFAAVILDLTIPGGMGGKETIKKLKEIAPDVKAIVSSGYSSDPIMAEYEKYGFSGIIIKPYRISDIADVLQKVVSSEGGSSKH